MNKFFDRLFGIIFAIFTVVIAFGVFIEGFLGMSVGYVFMAAGMVGYLLLLIWGHINE
jgi:hypothetical protein